MTTSKNTIVRGFDAIKIAEQLELPLSKYADPVEGARDNLTPDEARDIAREDLGLIYLTLPVTV